MAEILLVNPRRRRRKMSAKQAKYFGGKRRKRRAANPKVRARKRRSYKRNVYLNPAPRRRRRRSLTRSFRRRRSNPSFRGLGNQVVPMLKAGGVGAMGALGLDLLWGYGRAYLPAAIAGNALAQYAVKLLGALGVGIIGNKVMRGRGRDLAVGATTVVLHDAFKAQIQASFPQIQLGEYLTYAPVVGGTLARPSVRNLDPNLAGMGMYLSGIPEQNNDGNYSGEYTADGINGF